MRKVYVVTKCISIDDVNDQIYYFRFRGSYQGCLIKVIAAEIENYKLEIGDEYLLFLENIYCKDAILYGKASRVKKLFTTFPH